MMCEITQIILILLPDLNPTDIYQLGFKKKSITASQRWELHTGAADR